MPDKRGPLGDARPEEETHDNSTTGSLPQERPEDRENVGSVKPEDYPEEERTESDATGKP